MTDSLDRLATLIRKKRNGLPKKVSKAVQVVAIEVLDHLVENTPYDTTQALSNWQVNIGSGIAYTRGPYVAGRWGSSRPASVAAAKAAGRQGIKYHTAGKAIHITNNLVYIRGLNNGSISLQPGAFVQGAVAKGRAKLKRTKLGF